eukprot:4771900-Prymnesium_polylepis.1
MVGIGLSTRSPRTAVYNRVVFPAASAPAIITFRSKGARPSLVLAQLSTPETTSVAMLSATRRRCFAAGAAC